MSWRPSGNGSATPSGAAGGDLAGTYPNPTLAAIGSATGPLGDATHVATVTIDTKGRVTALTSTAISDTTVNGVTISANIATALSALLTVDAQTGTTYTLALADAGAIVTLSNGSAITVTVPTNASVAFPVGTAITLYAIGAGQVTVAAAGGVTVNGANGLKLSKQYSGALLVQVAANSWILTGDTTT